MKEHQYQTKEQRPPEYWKLPVTRQQLEEVRGIRDLARIRVYDLLKELATRASF